MAFQEQFERAVRWFERFRDLTHGREHTMVSDNYEDEIYAFFQNCYHLKDWIRHDGSVPQAMKDGVEAHINSSDALKLCADLCNSSKHFRLTKPPRSGATPTTGPKHFGLELGVGQQPVISLRVEVQSGGRTLDGYTIATEAMRDWAAFINSHGYSVQLPPSSPPGAPPTSAASAMAVTVAGHATEMRHGRVRPMLTRAAAVVADWLTRLAERWENRG